MKGFIKHALFHLAKYSIKKNKTKLILIYGWDWAEIVREVIYLGLSDKYNARRNTNWIRRDIGLPLFILGYNYGQTSDLKILGYLLKSILRTFTNKPFDHYLVASIHAKSTETLESWLKNFPIDNLVVLPFIEYPGISEVISKSIKNSKLNYVNLDYNKKDILVFDLISDLTNDIFGNMSYLKELNYDKIKIKNLVRKSILSGGMVSRIIKNLKQENINAKSESRFQSIIQPIL